MPVLGICRGMQLLNVACGGTLVQHLPDLLGHDDHRHTPGAFGDHEVRLQEGTLAARAVGGERSAVKSHHHQGVDELGEGLVAVGWSDADDTIEAIELPGKTYALGVLWHPEEDEREQGDRVAGRRGASPPRRNAHERPGHRAGHRGRARRAAPGGRGGDGRRDRAGARGVSGLAADRPGRARRPDAPGGRARGRAGRGPGPARGAQRRQADLRRPRRGRHGRRRLQLLRRAPRSGCSATRSRSTAAST